MLRPLQDKVVLKVKQEKEVTKSGIILASNSSNKIQIATVIAVGPGIISEGVQCKMEVKEKDCVIIEKGSGIVMEYDGEEYIIITQKDILVVLENE